MALKRVMVINYHEKDGKHWFTVGKIGSDNKIQWLPQYVGFKSRKAPNNIVIAERVQEAVVA